MSLKFHYTNTLGRSKTLVVLINQKNDNGDYLEYIIDDWTGEFCGSGENSADTIINFLANYGITLDTNPELATL